jgi:hypothetical protein
MPIEYASTTQFRVFDLFSRMKAEILRGILGVGNPKGIEAFSPRLRLAAPQRSEGVARSYPGCEAREITTLKELHLVHPALRCNPFRVVKYNTATQGRPSRNRANPGLNDPIPLGLKTRPLQYLERRHH